VTVEAGELRRERYLVSATVTNNMLTEEMGLVAREQMPHCGGFNSPANIRADYGL
jgi:hypothetical protein